MQIAPARALRVLRTVRQTGSPPRGYQGGRIYQNDGPAGGQQLPKSDAKGRPVAYREYDVNPKQPGVNRGPERLVVGSNGSAYYTADHYRTFTPVGARTVK